MLRGMFRHGEKDKVLRPVIQSILVSVMNLFCTGQGPFKKALHDQPMLQVVAMSNRARRAQRMPVLSDIYVPVPSDIAVPSLSP
jgi:hypothetical protein